MVKDRFENQFFFFNDTATTEIYTLSLHDALPISRSGSRWASGPVRSGLPTTRSAWASSSAARTRSEEHTSELQSPCNVVCRLLLEKKEFENHHELPPMHLHQHDDLADVRHVPTNA